MSAAAPSLTPEALPAVTVPFSRNGVGSLASFSSDVSRGCSSVSTMIGSALRCGTLTGTISLARRPLACAFAVRCCERRANLSWSSREIWYSSATFSPVSGIESVPNCLRHVRVHEAPADRRVVDLGLAREGALGLAHHERRARHQLDAAGDHHLGLAGLDGAGRLADRVEPRAAQAVDRRAGDVVRQPREQGGHARDVAVVLAGLVGAAEDHVVDHLRRQVRRARQDLPDDERRQVVGADLGEGAAVAADRRADAGADIGVTHVTNSPSRSRSSGRMRRVDRGISARVHPELSPKRPKVNRRRARSLRKRAPGVPAGHAAPEASRGGPARRKTDRGRRGKTIARAGLGPNMTLRRQVRRGFWRLGGGYRFPVQRAARDVASGRFLGWHSMLPRRPG